MTWRARRSPTNASRGRWSCSATRPTRCGSARCTHSSGSPTPHPATSRRCSTSSVPTCADRSSTLSCATSQDPDQRSYHLDLSGARLEHFRLEGRRIGRLNARGARFHGNIRLGHLEAAKPVLFTDASFKGRLDLREARLDGGVSFQRTQFHGEVVLDGAVVATFLDIRTTAPADQVGALLVAPQTRVDGAVDGWALAAP